MEYLVIPFKMLRLTHYQNLNRQNLNRRNLNRQKILIAKSSEKLIPRSVNQPVKLAASNLLKALPIPPPVLQPAMMGSSSNSWMINKQQLPVLPHQRPCR